MKSKKYKNEYFKSFLPVLDHAPLSKYQERIAELSKAKKVNKEEQREIKF